MAQAEQTYLFFMKCPDLKNLLSFTLELVISSDNRTALNIFHKRILKCRELLFSESVLLATPANFSKTEILAVMPKREFYSPVFQKKVYKMGLKTVKIDEVSPVLLQECLQYTAIAKLAPQWNNVRDLLVQGRDFLTVSDPLRAIKLDIFVNGEEITLSLTPKCIKMPHFKVETFSKLYEISSTEISIQEHCHVLPSYKRGNAVSLSKSIFARSIFKNYTEIKKHWKNMYGYRLPEIPENEVWYLNVVFNVPFSTTYTYPSFCVKPFGMTEIPRVDPQYTLNSFIGDFCNKVANVCQEKCLILDHKAVFPSLRLHLAENVVEGTLPRPGTTYNRVQNIPYRSSAPVQRCNLKNSEQECVRNSMNPLLPKSKKDLNLTSRIDKSIDDIFKSTKNAENNNAKTNYSSNKMPEKPLLHELQNIDGVKTTPIKTFVKFSNCQNDKNINNESYCSRVPAKVNPLDPILPEKSPASATRYAPDFSHLIANRCSRNYGELQTSSASEKPQTKYAPKFSPKIPKQVVQKLTVDSSVKVCKYVPEFRKSKIADESEKLSKFSNKKLFQTSNIETEPGQSKITSVAEESEASEKNSNGYVQGKQYPLLTQIRMGKNTSSKNQVRNKRKFAEDEKANKSKSVKPVQKRSKKAVKA